MLERFKALTGNARSGAGNVASNVYSTAMNHPKTTAAVVLGTGAAAALLWVVRRNGAPWWVAGDSNPEPTD